MGETKSNGRGRVDVAAVPPTAATDSITAVAARLELLCNENEMLSGELIRSYEQLNLIFEISDQIAAYRDPDAVERILVRRWGRMLAATDLFVHDGRRCARVGGRKGEGGPALDARRLRRVLKGQIAECRQRHRTMAPVLSPGQQVELERARVLLGTLHRADVGPRVVIALRPASAAAFDSRDVIASEAVLGYGGHVLSNLLMMRQLEQVGFQTVRVLANAIDAKDPYTCGHSERVGALARMLGEALGVSFNVRQNLEWGGILHDVGKIGVPEAILNKPGRLTPEEYEVIQRHPVLSHAMLEPVPALQPILPGVLYHHENHDGSGYPEGRAGSDIPLAGRVIHVADMFDALTSTRSYRAKFSTAKAFQILREGAGRISDPLITDVFIKRMEEFMRAQAPEFARLFPHLADEVGFEHEPAPLPLTGLSEPLRQSRENLA